MLTAIFITQLKKIPRYDFCYLEVTLGKCFDKNLTNQIRDFFKHIQKCPTKNILLMFPQVEAMDSTGIGILVNFQEELEQQGFSLKLVNVSSKILHLFEILGLADFFHIYPEASHAVASFFPTNENAFFGNPDWEKDVLSTPIEFANENKKNDPSDKKAIMSDEKVSVQEKDIRDKPKSNTDIEVAKNSEDVIADYPDELPKENKLVSAKKLHTIKIKKKSEDTIRNPITCKVEYYTRMLGFQEFPLKISLSGPTRKEKSWEIIPKISACLIVPDRIPIQDSDLPAEFVFSVTPMSKAITPSEIILARKYTSIRQVPLKISIVMTDAFKSLLIFGMIAFLLAIAGLVCTWLPDIDTSHISSNSDLLRSVEILLNHKIDFIFFAVSLCSFICSFILFSGAFLYYHYWLRPQKVSVQMVFHEKED